MGDYQVTCINKPNRNSTHEHITHIGNVLNNWRMTREDAISRIDAKKDSFYTLDRLGKRANVSVVRPSSGLPYLRTYADGVWNDNLLALDECGANCALV